MHAGAGDDGGGSGDEERRLRENDSCNGACCDQTEPRHIDEARARAIQRRIPETFLRLLVVSTARRGVQISE